MAQIPIHEAKYIYSFYVYKKDGKTLRKNPILVKRTKEKLTNKQLKYITKKRLDNLNIDVNVNINGEFYKKISFGKKWWQK